MKRNTLWLTVASALIVTIQTSSLPANDIDDGLLAHYPFDGTADDASGNGHDGTAFNNFEYVSGRVSQAIRLVGKGHNLSYHAVRNECRSDAYPANNNRHRTYRFR